MLVGKPGNNDKTFDLENYEEFYSHHQFQPIAEEDFKDVHELIPRFGWAFDKIDELKPRNLLDLGCLDGSFALTIAHHFETPVTGVDLTVDGITIANDRAKANNLNGTFYQGAVEDWLENFAEEGKTFDLITFFEIIEHVEDVQKVLMLIDRVLAPGGSVLVSTPAFESPLFGKDDEQNKCHIRLYTMEDQDRDEVNKYGHMRHATSITREIGKDRIIEMGCYSHLINVHYK